MRYTRLLILVFLSSFIIACKPTQTYLSNVDISKKNYQLGPDNKEVDPAIDAMIAPYRKEVNAQMGVKICDNEWTLKLEKPSSSLGNWFADYLHNAVERRLGMEVDITIQNHEGIRSKVLTKGDVTYYDIFNLMPFENTVVILTMDGVLLKTFLDKIASNGGWPINDGNQFDIIDGKAANIVINGEDFDIHKTYTVVVSDYLADGGEKCDFLKQATTIKLTDMKIRDLIIEECQLQKVIKANSGKRIIKE